MPAWVFAPWVIQAAISEAGSTGRWPKLCLAERALEQKLSFRMGRVSASERGWPKWIGPGPDAADSGRVGGIPRSLRELPGLRPGQAE